MTAVQSTAKSKIDLADLLSVTINSKQLEIVLDTILGRLDALEKDDNANANADGDEDANAQQQAGGSNNNNNKKNGDRKNSNAGNNNNAAGKDWSEEIAKLRDDLEKERLRSDNQQEAINDLEEAKETMEKQLKDAIETLKSQVADLEERKADKKKDVEPIADDVDALKKRVGDLEDKSNGLAARVATAEGLAAAANPDAAKDQGLSSFTDTLNDVLNKQKDLEGRLDGADKALEKNKNENGDALNRLAALEKNHNGAAADGNSNNNSSGPFATQGDLDALKKDLLGRLGNGSGDAAAVAPLTAKDRAMIDSVANDVDTLKKSLDDLNKLNNGGAAAAAKDRNLALGGGAAAGNNTNNNNSGADLSDLERRMAEVEAAADALKKNLADHRIATTKQIDDVKGDVEDCKDALGNAVKEIKALGQECSKNSADCQLLHDKKADKGDNNVSNGAGGAGAGPSSTPKDRSLLSAAAAPAADSDANAAQIAQLQKLVDALDGRVSGLAQDKASKDSVSQLTRDMADMKNALKALQNALAAMSGGGGANAANIGALLNGAGGGGNTEQLEKDMKDLQKRLDDLESWTKGQLIEIRATVDHIHHSKADAAIVANKAERDYVENAMEKLMHEVENVLNATNAGLIDTLDKSLNILRDMIDGKATKQDINKLQGLMDTNGGGAGGANGNGEVPDGLASYKAYRCLGCNRTMDSMRPRPMGSTMNGFTNRVPPASGRNAPASSQGPRQTLPLPAQPPAGYIQSSPK